MTSTRSQKKNIANLYPLSPTQQGMLFHTLYAPESGVYVVQIHCRLEGFVNLAAFKQAWEQAIADTPMLRTAFIWQRRQDPFQVVYRQVTLPWEEYDWSDLSPEQQQAQLHHYLQQDRERGFALEKAPLMRLTLIRLAPDVYQFVWSKHHLILDGWSTALVLQAVSNNYQTLSQGQAAPKLSARPYREYIAWLQRQELAEAETFWRERLRGFHTPTPLVVDRPRPSQAKADYTHQQIKLSPETTATLQTWAREQQLTLNTIVQAAWGILLSRYSGESDVVFGAVVSGRPPELAGSQTMIGLFINTLPVRVSVEPETELLPWLQQLQRQEVAARQYDYTPLVQVQQWSELPPQTPLFATMLTFENYPVDEALTAPGNALAIRDVQAVEQPTYALEVTVVPGNRLTLVIHYDRVSFRDDTIERLLGHFHALLGAMVSHAEQFLAALPMLAPEERESLLKLSQGGQVTVPTGCIHEQIALQAQTTPQAIAAVCGEQSLTYQYLHTRSQRLAQRLQQLGVRPNQLVGLYVTPSVEMLVGIVGILYAGGAYVPIDPVYPKERLAFMIEDSQVSLLLTQEELVPDLPPHSAKVICLDGPEESHAALPELSKPQAPDLEDLAYAIYTSGSTGRPKGVMVTHGNLAHSTGARVHYYGKEVECFLLLSSFAFDSSVAGIFWTLSQGGTLVIPPQEARQDVEQLAGAIADQGISHLLSIPSLYQALLDEAETLTSLQMVIVAGEACSSALVSRHYSLLPQTPLFNEYGPTEGTVWSSVYRCSPHEEGQRIPIGRAIANTQIYLLDGQCQLVPMGVPGEIHLGGGGVTKGYLHQPELSAEKFIPNPLFPEKDEETTLYKTGDLARYLPTGDLDYLGRLDSQVKLRGFRIELGEIEAVLAEHPTVTEAVVIHDAQQSRLLAYVVPQLEETPQWQEQHLQQCQTVYDELYGQSQTFSTVDEGINLRVWNSGYTQQPLPESEILEAIDCTVARILTYSPQKVLEIGCGTGLLLSRIAPHCELYWGRDISETAIAYLQERLTTQTPDLLSKVRLETGAAHEFNGLSPGAFDTIVLNEVVQHFPSVDYLLEVIAGSLDLLKPGGRLFIGGIRSLPLLEAFHASVQLHRAPDTLATAQLQQQIRDALAVEKDLIVDPNFFYALRHPFPQIARVEIDIARGEALNELTRFQYDVTLHLADSSQQVSPLPSVTTWDWHQEGLTLATLSQKLTHTQPDYLILQGVPNSRLVEEMQLLRLLANDPPATVGDLRAAVTQDRGEGVNPEVFFALTEQFPYESAITWSWEGELGDYDVILRQRDSQLPLPSWDLPRERPWQDYTNAPLQGNLSKDLIQQWRQWLRTRVSDYMIPSGFMVLEQFPISPNGKVNRQALPQIDRQTRPTLTVNFVAPQTAAQKAIAQLWQDILGVDRIGIEDNFFALGGHSLLATQVISRVRELFQVDVPLRRLFETPTVAGLIAGIAESLGGVEVVEAIAEAHQEIDQLSSEEMKTLLKQG